MVLSANKLRVSSLLVLRHARLLEVHGIRLLLSLRWEPLALLSSNIHFLLVHVRTLEVKRFELIHIEEVHHELTTVWNLRHSKGCTKNCHRRFHQLSTAVDRSAIGGLRMTATTPSEQSRMCRIAGIATALLALCWIASLRRTFSMDLITSKSM